MQAPPELLGIHTNMAGAIPPEIDAAAFAGGPPPDGLDEEERYAFDHVSFFYKHGLGYAQEMGNRPQTLYGLADSPVGLAAWIIDHDIWTYRQIARVFDGEQMGLTRDDIVDNITLYWLTNTGVSSARLYWENKYAFFAPKGVKVPTVVSAFPEEICPIPRKWAERPIPSCSTTRSIRRARTSPPGNSRRRCGRHAQRLSGRCASLVGEDGCRGGARPAPDGVVDGRGQGRARHQSAGCRDFHANDGRSLS